MVLRHLSISNCAAIATTYGPFGPRHLVMIIWSCLYLGYTIAFSIQLRSWNNDKSGQCYITSSISASGASHPYVDYVYISVTYVYVISLLYTALIFNYVAFNYTDYRDRILLVLDRGRQQLEALGLSFAGFEGLGLALFAKDPDRKQSITLLFVLLQYPVHMYSVFALRAANESRLMQGNTEQDWGFGQVVAVILLGSNVTMLVDGILSTCTVACGSAFSCELTD
jgi:hypothetical protein